LNKVVSSRSRRTYFTKPLVKESLAYLPAAIDYPMSWDFKKHLEENLHQNSLNARQRYAKYIANRFSHDGWMNLDLARALKVFGDSRTGREILYFEMLQAVPLLHEIASLWLAEQPTEGPGSPRSDLLTFLDARLAGRNSGEVATAAVNTFRKFGKIISPKTAFYLPVWAEPPLDAFLYVLARLYPERTMVRVDLFAGLPILRAMLWPQPTMERLLAGAERAGHISKITHLDQYHQFILAGTGEERIHLLYAANMDEGDSVSEDIAGSRG
jgi:hypothetical protein